MSPLTKSAHRPRVACEIGPGHVYAAKIGDRSTRADVVLSRTLAPEAVVPNLSNPNIADVEGVRSVLADVLSATAGRARDVSLVVPDGAVRVALLDFDTLPEKKAEADAVVRFRLKRTLPFDVEKAAISYHVSRMNAELRVVVAVMLRSILEEYENAVQGAGYLPGVVLPFSLAAMGNIDDSAPTMTVSVSQGTTTIAIMEAEQLLLYRTLDHDASLTPEALAEAVYPSVVFFQDTYGKPVERLLLSGIAPLQEAVAVLAEETGAHVAELVSPAAPELDSGTNRSQLSGVLGVLIQ